MNTRLRWEYVLVAMPVHQRVPRTHTFSIAHRDNLESPVYLPAWFWEPENWEISHMVTRRMCKSLHML